MGYQTDFVGYLHVHPPLNESERELIDRISGSIYLDQQATGPRPVSRVEDAVALVRETAPWGWSNWTACPQGCCLSYDGGDKANHMIPWLKYLMTTFLVPGATVQSVDGLDELSCDHVLNGMVVGSRRDNRELYSITVRDNQVEVELLWPGVKEWSEYPPLAIKRRSTGSGSGSSIGVESWMRRTPRGDLNDRVVAGSLLGIRRRVSSRREWSPCPTQRRGGRARPRGRSRSGC
jgi:hypothetical protein